MTKHEIVIETTRLLRVFRETNDNEVRNKVVLLNMPLVSTYLKKYKPYSSDQYQVACIGLILAVNTFDPSKKVPFSSWAMFCIERELHIAHKMLRNTIEHQLGDSIIRLDANGNTDSDDLSDKYDIFEDPAAELQINEYVEENQLQFLCDTVILPAIKEMADKSRSLSTTKLDMNLWEEYEYKYLMDLVFIGSQKTSFNLSKMAKKLGASVTRVKNRHDQVMQTIFVRMWEYMELQFNDLMERIRGRARVPQALLVLDPGKTTGWSLFMDGILAETGHVENCYDDKNISIEGIKRLFDLYEPDFVLYEDYRIYGQKLDQHNYSQVMTLRLIGAIETMSQTLAIPTHKQMAVTAKNYVTDSKLKLWGFYDKGGNHARDSIRHACYFLLFYKKGQDII